MKIKKNQLDSKHCGPIVDSVDGYDVIECRQCKFKHLDPIPADEKLAKMYADEFYKTKKSHYLKDAEEDSVWWMETYKNYFRLPEKHAEGKRLLDIGSGPGYFIKCGQDMGWDVLGFEPSTRAAEYSSKLGVKVVNSFFDVTKANQYGKFDVVCLNLVLEHIPDPVKFLQDVKVVLKPNGLIFVLSPNEYNPLQRVLCENLFFKPWWVSPPQHINYFDFKSIKKLLESLNFAIIDSTSTYPMEFFLLGGDNYVGKRGVGRKCHLKRKTLETNLFVHNPDLINAFYRDLAKNNIGREFVIVGKRND